jgi:hypothetical protein
MFCRDYGFWPIVGVFVKRKINVLSVLPGDAPTNLPTVH